MQMDLRMALVCVGSLAAACSGGSGSGFRSGDSTGNDPPVISGTPPAEAVVGEFYSFTPSAHDPEGRTLTFGIQYKPPWAEFDAKNGRLSGTPGPGQVGSHIEIAISASDGQSEVSLPAFAINVIGRGDGSATLSWYPPTENADGSVLTDLSGYRIYFGRHPRDLDNVLVLDNPGLSRYVVEGLTPRRWFFAMTSVNRDGIESSRSKVVSKKVG